MKARVHIFFVAAIASAIITLLVGCSAIREIAQGGPVGIAMQFATMRYVEDAGSDQAAARAAEVRAAVERVRAYSAGVEVSLEDLKAYALNELARDLPPSDRFLALQIINLGAGSLEGQIGVGKALDPEDKVALEKLLDMIRDATLFYG